MVMMIIIKKKLAAFIAADDVNGFIKNLYTYL